MEQRLTHILKRIDSRPLSNLWRFYRNYFSDDDSCLTFLYNTLSNEPEFDGSTYSVKFRRRNVSERDFRGAPRRRFFRRLVGGKEKKYSAFTESIVE